MPVGVAAEDVGVGEVVDLVAHQHGDEGRADLDGELQLGGQSIDVVKNAQNDDDHRAQQHAPQLGGEGQEEQHAEDEAEEDGQPPHPGDGVVMHPATVPGDIHRADLEGQGADHRGGDQSHHRGHQQGGGHRAHHLKGNIRGNVHGKTPFAELMWGRRRERAPGQRATKPTFL